MSNGVVVMPSSKEVMGAAAADVAQSMSLVDEISVWILPIRLLFIADPPFPRHANATVLAFNPRLITSAERDLLHCLFCRDAV